jgi:hypothetical protein
LAESAGAEGELSRGISLEEMKAIAAEVGLDPILVERAAHLVPAASRRTALQRMFGGPFSSRADLHFPAEYSTQIGEQLLAVARSVVGTPGQGEATASGMSWAGGAAVVTAHSDEGGTRVRISVDKRHRLVLPFTLAPLPTIWVLFIALEAMPHGPGEPFSTEPLIYLVVGLSLILALVGRSLRKTGRATLSMMDELVEVLSRSLDRGDGPSSA